jgi:branched-subunit amino acid aminotransferase/4-amino-4-deoxychorismate lyase
MTSSEQPGLSPGAASPGAAGPAGTPLVSLNGVLLPEREAFVPALDRSVTHGIGLYETFKLAGGVPVFFDEHMDRLQSGLEVLEIAVPWDRATIARSIVELSGASGIADGGCRVLVTGGAAWGGPSVLIRNDVREQPARPLRVISHRGIRVSGALKAMTFMQSYLAQRAALAAGADDAIFVDDEGRMFEGATSNIFLARGGALVTTPAEGAILPGVMRAALERVAEADGIAVVEAYGRVADLRPDDAMFLTSSVRGIVAVAAVDDHDLRVDDAMLQRLRLLIAAAEQTAAATFRERYL